MKLRKVSHLCCLVLVLFGLYGCGFKGPLMTPEQAELIKQQNQQQQQQQQQTPPASSSEDQ